MTNMEFADIYNGMFKRGFKVLVVSDKLSARFIKDDKIVYIYSHDDYVIRELSFVFYNKNSERHEYDPIIKTTSKKQTFEFFMNSVEAHNLEPNNQHPMQLLYDSRSSRGALGDVEMVKLSERLASAVVHLNSPAEQNVNQFAMIVEMKRQATAINAPLDLFHVYSKPKDGKYAFVCDLTHTEDEIRDLLFSGEV